MRLERWLYSIPLRLRSLFRAGDVDRELDEELQFHVQRLTDEHIARGVSPAEARLMALRAMNGLEQRKEECRDTRRVRLVEDVLQDLRYAARTLLRSRGFTAAAIVTLHMTYTVRTESDPLALAPALRGVLRSVDRNQPAQSIASMGDVMAAATAEPGFQARLLGAFAALALLLSLVGTYGVLAYSVAQQTHEIGLRMALGARRGAVMWMVIRRTLVLGGLGVAIGTLGALWAGRLLATFLFEIEPTDPATFVFVALMILLAALAAGVIPARRATRVDPLVALRHE